MFRKINENLVIHRINTNNVCIQGSSFKTLNHKYFCYNVFLLDLITDF